MEGVTVRLLVVWKRTSDQQRYLVLYENDLFCPGYLSNFSIVGLPLIHLGYAYELSSRVIGIEALALTACSYDFMHNYLDDEAHTFTGPTSDSTNSNNPLAILDRIRHDNRFNNLPPDTDSLDFFTLFQQSERAVLEHWNAWKISEQGLTAQFEASQRTAVALLVATCASGPYNKMLARLLASSHAVRVLLPHLPGQSQISVVRQWWLLTVATYIGQARPEVDLSKIESVVVGDRDWVFVRAKALEGGRALDADSVQGRCPSSSLRNKLLILGISSTCVEGSSRHGGRPGSILPQVCSQARNLTK